MWNIQTSFNSGVVGGEAKGRVDLKQYYEGMETAENVICLPQGGVTRRPGFEYLATLSEESRLFAFEFNVDQVYVVAADSSNFYIYEDDGNLADTVAHSWGADILAADYAQSADSLILVHPDNAPGVLTRTNPTTFVWSAISLQNIPQYDFNDASSPTPTSFIETLQFVVTLEGDVYQLRLQLRDGATFTSPNITFSGDTTVNEEQIAEALLDFPVVSSDPSTVTVAFSSGTTYTITLSGASADDYQEVTFAFVDAVNSNARPAVTVTQAGVAQREDVWSATRGWPSTVTFHESRLVFGGSDSLPTSLWLSRTNDFYNFKTGSGRADEAIFISLDTDQLNEIVGVKSNRNLQVFTSGQEFYVPASPITPETITVVPQSAFGSKQVKPIVIDGFTLFIQRTGKSIRSFTLTPQETQYDSSSVSLLAPDLISDPSDSCVQRGQLNIDSSYAYFVNDDGTMAMYSSKVSENINNWVLWDTEGSFKHCCVSGNDLYVQTERVINGATVYYLEKLWNDADTDMYCDAGVSYSQVASTTVSGLAHLNGESISVIADGSVQDDETPSSGSITLDRTTTNGYVGINYTPTVKTMPATFNTQTGQMIAKRKRFVRVHPLMRNSRGVYINTVFIPERQFDVTLLDEAGEPYSGISKNVRILGWTYSAQLTITQNDPLPMTVLSLTYEVET